MGAGEPLMVASTSQPQAEGGSTPVPDPTILSTEQVQREVKQLRELLESQIKAQKDLCDEKFSSVDKFLDKVEEQRVEQKSDTKTAVDAALAAQKEAIFKTEGQVADQIKQLRAEFTALIAGQGVSVSDLKDRVVKIESIKIGGQESRAGLYAALGVAVMLVLAVISVIAFATPA